MATRTEYRGGNSAAAEREHHRGNPRHQAARFIGLFLSPLVGLVAAWLIHLWIGGVHLHSPRGNVDLGGNAMAWMVGTLVFILAATGLISWLAWEFAEHRKTVLRASLAGSVAAVGVFFALNVAVGPGWRAGGVFLLACAAVATIWSIARLDVTRNDKRSDENKDDFLEKNNLKGWRARKTTPVADENGEPLATEIEFQHAEGDTVERLQEAVPAFESATGSPRGFSRATGSDRADRSTLTIQHIDPLEKPSVLPPPSAPGGSIREGLLTGKYANGQLCLTYLAGGKGFPPSVYMFMGMTRSGKTWGENAMLTEAGSRRDAVILYLNKSKGMQDIRPVIPVIEAAVIADEAGMQAQYKQALQQVERIMNYRQRQLGLFGVSAWSPETCWDSPPWRTDPETGQRVQMERMPALLVHIGEADTILSSDYGTATNITSKGLSLGVISGYSLQRAAATKMSTDLRFNIGTVWCFGCGDSDSSTMALSGWVVKAGAHPENWKNRKPGYHYFEGVGIEEELFPVPARTFSMGPGGTDLREELLRRNLESASRMAKLDRGSANATADPGKPGEPSWWDRIAAGTDEIRKSLLTTDVSAGPQTADVSDQDDFDDEEMEREMRETTHNDDGFELYPQDPDTGVRPVFDDAAKPLPPAPAAAAGVSWDDPKPGPRDRAAALVEFARTLTELSGRADLRDPADPTGCTVIVTADLIAKEYRYRSRPFFSETLNGMAQGRIGPDECPTNLGISAAPDLGATAGKYRISRPTTGYAQ